MSDPLYLVLSLAGFALLTFGTAVCVGAEFSLTALERSTVDADLAERGDLRARIVAASHRRLSFQLSAAQLGITITTLITGYIAEPVFAVILRPAFEAIGLRGGVVSGLTLASALIIATSVSMVLGELIPKNLAIARPLPTARLLAPALAGFATVFRPVILGLNASANTIVRRTGIEPADELASARSASELGALVRNSARQGTLDADTAVLVDRSLAFGERTADELMTPRPQIKYLEKRDLLPTLIATARETGHSKFPIVDGDLDHIIGVVHVKQAFTVPAARRATMRMVDLARAVTVVPESLDGDSVMKRVRADGMQVAIVADEYGGTAGIVTVEDLIEEIVGDVTDEHDDERADVQREGDGYLCSGLVRIDELEGAVGYAAPDGDYDTLGGLVMFALGRIAAEGDCVDLPERSSDEDDDELPGESHWRARVVGMDGRRIDLIALTPIDPNPVDESAASDEEGRP